MKLSFWGGLGALLLAGQPQLQLRAQALTGVWQGVETETGEDGYWPAVLRVQKRAGASLLGVLYQEAGGEPGISVTFQMEGTPTPAGLQLEHVRKLHETGRSPLRYWCVGSIAFTYDATQEKLTGHATYQPLGECDTGTFTFYRIRLKSAATVPAGALSTLRVSGRDVRWFADAELKHPVATGNTYPTRLRKTTTFYLTQGFYPSAERPVVPITIRVSGEVASRAGTFQPSPALPAPARPDRLGPALTPAPVVLPTVLFRVATAALLPEAQPALDQLTITLKAQPTLRLRVAGHTDRVGESTKNQLLSEQRAAAVKDYLVRAGVAAKRISTVGYGDTQPLYPSPDARNRRVEVMKVE